MVIGVYSPWKKKNNIYCDGKMQGPSANRLRANMYIHFLYEIVIAAIFFKKFTYSFPHKIKNAWKICSFSYLIKYYNINEDQLPFQEN